MSTYGLASHRWLTTLVVVVAIAGALAAGLGACQKEQTATTPAEQQSMKAPPADQNTGAPTGNMPQTPDRSDAGQKSQ